ncbi:hypothetical protein BCR41DRAFT_423166 [Lobosporangium transversale]|uniref:WD40-repeat-containing domain protein n=1 Tax=Lobosporangium transversale TaxID=64571 RepID=A0A1Y2GJF9_9FUNG|nr:hypothetical protein BCR41DRAFT_423166 [Lobosporangium transversale]ORZ12527.1 hypothetical protein BCR41DRAFT_423166 [Lobosporangium transversale]|eukprot:XP_021880146.1 hypothetical protein BCR41DRAFT_423166 [Lobosporangium transversale]
MSASRRKTNALAQSSTSETTAPVLSGAEMLVLQQNIKQYIITRQTRALTAHELEEFEKIKEKLLPNLLRYSQRAPSVLTSEPNEKSTERRRGVPVITSTALTDRETIASSRPNTEAFPSQRTTIQSQSNIPALEAPAKAKAKAKTKAKPMSKAGPATASTDNKQSAAKTEPLQSNTGPLNLTQASTTAASSRESVGNTAKKGDNKKRPKIEIYQDPENVPRKKRARAKAQEGDANDSDKENRNPLDSTSSKPKRKALGDSTNVVNTANVNTNTKQRNRKDKGVIHESTLKNPTIQSTLKSTTTAATPTSKALSNQGTQRPQLQRSRIDSRQPSTKVVSFKTPLESTLGPQDKREISQEHVTNHPPVDVETEEYEQPETPAYDLSQQNSEAEANDLAVNVSTSIRAPRKSKDSVIEILASVEDDDPAASFDPYIKSEKASPVRRIPVVDYEIIPDSEDSNEEEATLPAPNFLLDDLPEEENETTTAVTSNSPVHNAIVDLHGDEPTLPMPDFLSNGAPEDLEDQTTEERMTLSDLLAEDRHPDEHIDSALPSTETTFVATQGSKSDVGIMESTRYADGVWCIEDCESGVVSAVCGYTKQWIAIETNQHVRFLRLIGDSLSESRWFKYLEVSKEFMSPMQLIFAPDDSFAILLNPIEQSFIKVSLDGVDDWKDSTTNYKQVSWAGTKPFLLCRSLVVNAQNQGAEASYQLVFAADKPGSICLIPIPNDDDPVTSKVSPLMMSIPGARGPVNSVLSIRNASSLILASCEHELVLWDLNDHTKPVSIVDTSFVLPSSLPRYSSLNRQIPEVMFATVPTHFFKQYKHILDSEGIPYSQWPILAVLKTCDTEVDDSDRNEVDRCALFVIKGNLIELVHKFQGSASISFAASTPRFVTCSVKQNGKDALRVWDILKSEPVIQLSVMDPPPRLDLSSFWSEPSQQPQQASDSIHQEKVPQRVKRDKADREEEADVFSGVSTLSSPPDLFSSSPYPSPGDGSKCPQQRDTPVLTLSGSGNPSEIPSRLTEKSDPNSGHSRLLRQPERSINLISVSLMERKHIQFAVQPEQHWVVVVQQDMSQQNPTVIHIMDFMSILSSESA